jgi:hypothetical protein
MDDRGCLGDSWERSDGFGAFPSELDDNTYAVCQTAKSKSKQIDFVSTIDTCTGWNRLRKPNHDRELMREAKQVMQFLKNRRYRIHCGRKDQDLRVRPSSMSRRFSSAGDILPSSEPAQRFRSSRKSLKYPVGVQEDPAQQIRSSPDCSRQVL